MSCDIYFIGGYSIGQNDFFIMFVPGKLHNLVKALADEEIEDNNLRPSVSYSEKKPNVVSENGFLLGYGIRGTLKQPTGVTAGVVGGDHVGETTFFPLKGTGKRYLGPLISKPLAYLSAFILYIATIGDIVDGVDTTHDFNFFTLVYERSNDVRTSNWFFFFSDSAHLFLNREDKASF